MTAITATDLHTHCYHQRVGSQGGGEGEGEDRLTLSAQEAVGVASAREDFLVTSYVAACPSLLPNGTSSWGDG